MTTHNDTTAIDEKPISIRVAFDAVGDSYETELLPTTRLGRSEYELADATPLLAVEVSIVKICMNGEKEVLEKLSLTPEQWRNFADSADVSVFHRECTESGRIDIARAMELAQCAASSFRTVEQHDRASNALPAASAHSPATRRKPRP